MPTEMLEKLMRSFIEGYGEPSLPDQYSSGTLSRHSSCKMVVINNLIINIYIYIKYIEYCIIKYYIINNKNVFIIHPQYLKDIPANPVP